MGHADVLLEEFGVFLNEDLLFVGLLGCGLRNDLVVRFRDVDLDEGIGD